MSFDKSKGFGLTSEEMINIGKLHNEFALKLEKRMDLSCTKCSQILKRNLIDILEEKLRKAGLAGSLDSETIIEKALIDATALREIDFSLKEWKPSLLSDSGFKSYGRILDEVDLAESVLDVNNRIDDLKVLFEKSSHSEFEKEVLISSAEVARYSFELWAPEDIGGLGLWGRINGELSQENVNYGDGIILSKRNDDEDSNDSEKSKKRWCWKCAVAGDVAGLASYFTSLGVVGSITAAAIPGTNGILALSAAATSVGGSVIGGSQVTSQID